ncbi:MAG: acyl-CoA dehydratase activase [Desulfobacterium sp.]
MISVGIDVGSITTKGAILKGKKLLGTHVVPTGYNLPKAAQAVLDVVLKQAGLRKEEVNNAVATGYGRNRVDIADRTITEITCHAAGAYFMTPKIKGVIDIGGQDSKAILLDSHGHVENFVMNDKCAAGTGRFLEVMARALEVDLDAFGDIAKRADQPARVSSLCTVFAESEVISLISQGERKANIIAGIHQAIAARVVAMSSRIGIKAPVVMTGGVARNSGVVRAISKKMGTEIIISDYAQINGAIGAALLASNQ